MTRARSVLAILACAGLGAAVSACVPDFDTDLSQLDEPRVLAIRAEPAEAAPRKTVTLQALVAVPEGQRAARLDWTQCLARKPLTELGPVSPVCLGAADGSTLIDLGSGSSVTALLEQDACKLFGPERPTPTGGDGAGRPADPDVTGGYYQPFLAHLGGVPTLGNLRVDCDLASVGRDTAVEYRQRYRANENPRIQSLARSTGNDSWEELSVDAAVTVAAGSSMPLRASWEECSTESRCGDGLCTAYEDAANCAMDCQGTPHGCTGAEPYVSYDPAARRLFNRREGMGVAFYASRGHFTHEQTGVAEDRAASQSHSESTYEAPSQPGPATIWVVIRDTRGGQAWEARHLMVVP